jgi:hypothetical protein
VHYIETDRRTGKPMPCRLAFVSEVPKHLTREPFDGCPNGTEGLWNASLAVIGRTGLIFEEGLGYLHPKGSDDIWGDEATASWHCAEDCEGAS